MSPNRPEEDAPIVNPLNGPQNEQRGTEGTRGSLSAEYADTAGRSLNETRITTFGPRHDASIEQTIQENVQIKRTMGNMSQVLTGVRSDAQNQNKNLHDLASQMVSSQTRLQEISAESREFHAQSWNR